MSDRFDELIHVSMPDMPDAAEYRRLNRVPLRTPVKRFPGLPKPGPSFVAATTCLVLMVVFSGQVSQLGSDDLDMEQETVTNWNGEELTIHKDSFTGMNFNSEGSPEKVKDLQHFFLTQDSDPVRLVGMAYGGKQAWTVYGVGLVEGKLDELKMDNPPELPEEELPRMFEFYPTYYRDIRTRSNLLRPDNQYRMTVYGVEFLIKQWKHTYPGYGEVTFSVGLPHGQ